MFLAAWAAQARIPPHDKTERGEEHFVAPDTVEFDTEPIVGWRTWKVKNHRRTGRLMLHSVTYQMAWPYYKPMRAHCMWMLRKSSPVEESCSPPELSHECGVYAKKTAKQAYGWANGCGFGVLALVIGRVSLWGKVLKFEQGYRAEYAYPLDFVECFFTERVVDKQQPFQTTRKDTPMPEMLHELAGLYGVGVGVHDQG